MNFNKIIDDMKSLQDKVNAYEKQNNMIKETINSINKDIIKLEKKFNNETDEISKNILNIKIVIMRDIINRFEMKGK